MRKCSNCKHRTFWNWGVYESCMDYEMVCGEEDDIRTAAACTRYELDDRDEYDDTPCSTWGDYSPSDPWNAPGMSVRDFI